MGAVAMNRDHAPGSATKAANEAANSAGTRAARRPGGRLPWPAAALLIAAMAGTAWLLIFAITTWLLR